MTTVEGFDVVAEPMNGGTDTGAPVTTPGDVIGGVTATGGGTGEGDGDVEDGGVAPAFPVAIGAWVACKATTQVAEVLSCEVKVPVTVAEAVHVGESDPGVSDDSVASCTDDVGVAPEYT